jgi:hypothetical protein
MTYFPREFNAEISASYTNLEFESFARALAGAPIEKQRKLLRLIAVDAHRRCFNDLYQLAGATGVVARFGEVTIRDDLATTLGWGRS